MEKSSPDLHDHRLREATLQDCPGILYIINDSILNSTALYDYQPQTLEARQRWFGEKQAVGYPVIVAEEKGMIAGFASYGSFRERPAYKYTVEHSVYVHPDFRGRGIAKHLLSDLIRIATQKEVHTMIGGIDADNKVSIGLHKAFGFVERGYLHQVGYKFGRWLDLVFMQLVLENDFQPKEI